MPFVPTEFTEIRNKDDIRWSNNGEPGNEDVVNRPIDDLANMVLTFKSDLEQLISSSIVSPTPPSSPSPFMWWIDSSNSSTYYLKQRSHDNVNWISVYKYTVSTQSFELLVNSASSTKLLSAKTIGMTGDVSWTSSAFDGTSNVSGVASLSNTGIPAGTYTKLTVDTKGRATAGSNPTTLAGYGITDAISVGTSQRSKTFFAAPNASNGSPTFRTIVASDIPTLNQNTTGNAGTASALQNNRTINDVVFNGSQNIDINNRMGLTMASASTVSIGALNTKDIVHISGTTNISSFGVCDYPNGTTGIIIFDGSLNVVHNATSMILPGASNIITAAGDIAVFVCENASLGYWRCISYVSSAISSSELNYLNGATSNIQTQINTKAPSASPTLTGTPLISSTTAPNLS